MNNEERKPYGITGKFRSYKLGKIKDVLLLAALGFALLLVSWQVFRGEDSTSTIQSSALSENERKISRLLQEINGVGRADVMICETEEGVQSVVVVCDGANDLQVIMNIREAVSAALGTEGKSVKIYLKKE